MPLLSFGDPQRNSTRRVMRGDPGRAAWAIPVLLAMAACGGSSSPGAPTTCGVSGMKVGAECSRLGDCGAGASNEVHVAFCEHCPARADSHVCEAGVCRALDAELTNIDYNFIVSQAVASAQSYIVAAMNPTMADGGTLTCGALLSSCPFVDNGALNARNSTWKPLPGGASDFISGRTAIDPGQGRMLFIQLVSEPQGKGTVLARGCKDALDVARGEMPQSVTVDLTAL